MGGGISHAGDLGHLPVPEGDPHHVWVHILGEELVDGDAHVLAVVLGWHLSIYGYIRRDLPPKARANGMTARSRQQPAKRQRHLDDSRVASGQGAREGAKGELDRIIPGT
jgi:hypothetical protein